MRELDRAFGAIEPRPRFVGGCLGLLDLRLGRPAPRLEIVRTGLGGDRLRDHAGGGAEFGVGLFGLQPQVDFVEHGQRLTGGHQGADLDQPLLNLAGHPEAEIGFDAWPDGPHKTAIGDLRPVVNGGHQDRPGWGGRLSRDLVTRRQGAGRQQ